MKYNPPTQTIPQDKRAELNNTILALIDTGTAEAQGISRQDIFEAYTGVGGLSGLSRKDYDNYYEYSEAKKEVENGQFFTPDTLAHFLMDCIQPSEHDIIADLTCGSGVFVNHVPAEHNFYGCELDGNAFKVAQYLYPAAQLTRGDIRNYEPGVAADIVVGNPPFNLKWSAAGSEYQSQIYYCMKANELLRPGGLLAVITPLSFLADDFSDKGDIGTMNKMFSFLCSCPLPRGAFRSLGVADYSTKAMFFQKRTEHITHTPYDHRQAVPPVSETIFYHYVKPAKNAAGSVRQKLRAEQVAIREGYEQFFFQTDKLLYDIRQHPATRAKLGKCRAYLDKYLNQTQPEGMAYEAWIKTRLTEKKVIAYLQKALQSQNPKRKDPPRNDTARPERRKKREVERQSVPFDEMEVDPAIDTFLRGIVFVSHGTGEEKRLNPMQLLDSNKILQKRYGFLQWEQGSGKTLHGTANALYRLERDKVRQVFIVSTAISIKNNWADVLHDFGIPSTLILRARHIDGLQDGGIALITLDMVSKYRKQLSKYIKMKRQNVSLIFDESDAIVSVDSKRTKSMLEVFRRVRYKTLMTGTSTRNNINEFWPQLELLYNNSDNMICESEYIYEVTRNDDGSSCHNSFYNDAAGSPFPPYKKGYSLFAAAHLPEKITVFGIGQKTQDIYNAEDLKKILDKTVITRTFEEVTGKQIYDVIQHNVEFTDEDRAIYSRAVKEFERMRWQYFSSTGNSRKDSMLRLIQQITLLLRICAAPDSMNDYGGRAPAKQQAVMNLLEKWGDTRVAIGVRHIATLNTYAAAIAKAMPERPVVIVTGDSTTLKKRKNVLLELEKTKNGILLCTQQSLSCSINADFIDKAIIPELHWNNASMSQWYFRFVRYNSTRQKEIHFVTYAGSIESNLLHMVVNKEKLNLFMKDQVPEAEEVLEKFGIDYELFNMLMTRERDEDGHLQIRWGQQEIV